MGEIWKRVAGAAIPVLVIGGVGAGFVGLQQRHQRQLVSPDFGFLGFGDVSYSFKLKQLEAQRVLTGQIYEASFGNEPTDLRCYAFGDTLEEVSTGLTVSKTQAGQLIRGASTADPNGTRFALVLSRIETVTTANPQRTFLAVIQSDAQATDLADASNAALKLSRVHNLALVVVVGALPKYRLSLRQALAPLANRLEILSSVDATPEAIQSIASRVHSSGTNK